MNMATISARLNNLFNKIYDIIYRMRTGEQTKSIPKSVHAIQAHSYTFYFIALLFGVLLDFLFPLKLLNQPVLMPISTVFIIFASFLIIWAQRASEKFKRKKMKENITKESFCNGPYSFIKNPTHLGLFILTLGFGILANAVFVILFAIVSFVVTKFIFLKKEEKILEVKYGAPYIEYKKSMRS